MRTLMPPFRVASLWLEEDKGDGFCPSRVKRRKKQRARNNDDGNDEAMDRNDRINAYLLSDLTPLVGRVLGSSPVQDWHCFGRGWEG